MTVYIIKQKQTLKLDRFIKKNVPIIIEKIFFKV